MTVSIKHRSTSAVLFAREVDDSDPRPLRTALQRAVVAGANLAIGRSAPLRSAPLISPPESRAWKYRAANAMKRFMGALGWSVGGADPRVQTLAAALREACTSPCSPARYRELLKLADEADAP